MIKTILLTCSITLLATTLGVNVAASPKKQPAPLVVSGMVKTITLKAAYLTEKGNFVIFAPNSDSRESSYDQFHFKRADFNKHLGSVKKFQGSKKIKVRVEKSYNKTDSSNISFDHYFVTIIK